MGTVGDGFDNAMCESLFATLECELLDRKTLRTQAEARLAVFSFIEGSYDPRRRHSAIGNISPMGFEARHADSISADELDGTPRFRGTEGSMEPLAGRMSESRRLSTESRQLQAAKVAGTQFEDGHARGE